MIINIIDEAQLDFLDLVSYYSNINPNINQKLIKDFEKTIYKIKRHQKLGQKYQKVLDDVYLRNFLLELFMKSNLRKY